MDNEQWTMNDEHWTVDSYLFRFRILRSPVPIFLFDPSPDGQTVLHVLQA